MRSQYQQRPAASNHTAHPYPKQNNFSQDIAAKLNLLGEKLKNERNNIVQLLIHGKAKKIWDDKPPKGVFFGGLKYLPRHPNFDPPAGACFKCWDATHDSPNCQQAARFLFCFNCGRKDIELPDCPRCREAFVISYPPEVRKAIETSTVVYHELLLQRVLLFEQQRQRNEMPPQGRSNHFYNNHRLPNNVWSLSEPPRVPCKFEPLDEISRRIDNVLNEFPPVEKVTSLFSTQNRAQPQFDTPFFRDFEQRLRRETAAPPKPLGLVSTNRIDAILQEQPEFSAPPVQKNVFSRLQNNAGPIRNKPGLLANPYGMRKKFKQNLKQQESKGETKLGYVSPFLLRKKGEAAAEVEQKDMKQTIERSPSPQIEIIKVVSKEKNHVEAEDNDDLPSNVKRRFGERLGAKVTEEPADCDDQASVQSIEKCLEEDTDIVIHVDGETRRCLNDSDDQVLVQAEEQCDEDDASILIHIDEEGRRSLFAS